MCGSITKLIFRDEECEKRFFEIVPPLPVTKAIRKNHGASPHIMVKLCDWYGFDVREICKVYVPGRKELK